MCIGFFCILTGPKGYLYGRNYMCYVVFTHEQCYDVVACILAAEPPTIQISMVIFSLSLPPFVVTTFPSAGFHRVFLRTFDNTHWLSVYLNNRNRGFL